MLVRLKLWMIWILAWWKTRKNLVSDYTAIQKANIDLEDQSTRAVTETDRISHQRDQAATELKEARQEIEMLQGKIDVITNQIELSATIISSYQAVEETRIAIATADRVRALAEPTEERMQ